MDAVALQAVATVATIGHLSTHSWGRASTPSTQDKPGRFGRAGVYMGRKLHGKNALANELKAAVRLQRVVRGWLERARLREQELDGVRFLHGGLQQLPLPAVVALSRAAHVEPDQRRSGHVQTIHDKLVALESLYGKLFPGIAPGMQREILRHLQLASSVKGEVIRMGGELVSLEDTLYIVLSGSVGLAAVRKRVLHTDRVGGACLKHVVTQEETVIARVGGRFGGLMLNEETGRIERAELPQTVKDGGEITALTDCVYATLRWQDYARISGNLLKLTLQALHKIPSERTDSETRTLLSCFGDIDIIEELKFKTMKEQLCHQCRHKRVHNGEPLFKQGQYAESCYIVVQGYVRVIVDGESVAVLGPGDSFGQQAVMGKTRASRVRTSTVIGGSVPGLRGGIRDDDPSAKKVSFCDLAEITRSTYKRVIEGSVEEVDAILRKKGSQRTKNELEILANLFAQTSFFKEQLKSSLVQLKCCRMLKMRRLLSREVLFRQGDRGEEFFIVVKGSLVGEISGANKKVFRLGPGDSFGELSSMGRTEEERIRTASVTCAEQDCLLVVLSRDDYLRVTGKLEAEAMAALRKPVALNPVKPTSQERSKSETNVVWSYLKELPFFGDLRFPLLQKAVCNNLELKRVAVGSHLTEEGRTYPGNIYFLLRGGINVMGAGGNKIIDTYRPVVQFVDSAYALHPDMPGEKEKDKQLRMEQLGRAINTLVSLPAQARALSQSKVLYVSNIPVDATAEQLMNKFATFGNDPETCILSVKIWKSWNAGAASPRGRSEDTAGGPEHGKLWAAIEFRESRDSVQAERPDVHIMMRGTVTENKPVATPPSDSERTAAADENAADEAPDEHIRVARDFVLNVEGAIELAKPHPHPLEEEEVNSDLIDSWPNEDQERPAHADDEGGTMLAVLSRAAYLDSTIKFLERVIAILQTEVSDRTVEQLVTLEQMFDNTAIFKVLDPSAQSSGMLRRNICRFVGCQIIDA